MDASGVNIEESGKKRNPKNPKEEKQWKVHDKRYQQQHARATQEGRIHPKREETFTQICK